MSLNLSDLSPQQVMAIGAELKKKPKEELRQFIESLDPKEREELLYNPYIWLRENQYFPVDLEKNIQMFCAGRGAGKACKSDTPIFTAKGWKELGEIQVGDVIFDERGESCNVTAVYDPKVEVAYEIEFDTGEKIVACEDHLWTTWTHLDRKQYSRKNVRIPYPKNWSEWKDESSGRGPTTKTTKEIVETFRQSTARKDLNHSIPVAEPVRTEKTGLPLHPYVLGVWLGDGCKRSFNITCGDTEVADHIKAAGFPNLKTDYKLDILMGDPEIRATLRSMGMQGDKHIPKEYLTASIEDRQELIRGLLDSDGFIDPRKGLIEFSQKREDISEDVQSILASLGEKVTLRSSKAKLYGKDYGYRHRVCWKPTRFNPFKLKRKADIAEETLNKVVGQVNTQRQRMMKSFREVPVPECGMRCLTVDSPSRLFLIGRTFIPTHNTFTGAKWITEAVEVQKATRLVLSAPTLADIKRVMWSGESGLEAMYPENHPNRPEYIVSQSIIRWPKSGAVAILVPAESPERARGHNSSHAWLDEIGSFGPNGQEFFESLQMGMRLYPSQTLITTTPRPTPLVIDLFNRREEDVRLVTGSTFDNRENLDARMLKRAERMMNTPLGRQEILGELALSNPAALWSPDLIEESLVSPHEYPRRGWVRAAIGVDPSANKKNSDLTGICVAVEDISGDVIVWRDYTGTYTSDQWATLLGDLYDEYSEVCPTLIVIEDNGVGAAWGDLLEKHRRDIAFKMFSTTKNKFSRIGQTSYMFEAGKVKMNRDGEFGEMQTEMTSWTGHSKDKSPDRLDSMSFAVNQLLYKKQNVTMAREMLF